jgi:Flp pilus assembly protein TadD
MSDGPGTLYVVPTPIGNLEDMTHRAVRILREVDLVACEDTRRTSKLLSHYAIERPVISCHRFNERRRLEPVLERLRGGGDVALVADAGTPGISDPGTLLVRAALDEGFRVCPIPGPSAAVALLRESVERNRDVYLVRSLAQVLIMNGDFAEVEEVLQLYEEIAPDDGRIAILRGDCLDRQGHPQQAIAEYENAARLDPNRVGIQAAERIARVRARTGADPGS